MGANTPKLPVVRPGSADPQAADSPPSAPSCFCPSLPRAFILHKHLVHQTPSQQRLRRDPHGDRKPPSKASNYGYGDGFYSPTLVSSSISVLDLQTKYEMLTFSHLPEASPVTSWLNKVHSLTNSSIRAQRCRTP